MRRVASVWAAAATAVALGGCGDSRPVAAQAAGQTGCASCHTAPGEGPPFRDQTGSTDPTRLTVGAHDAHLHGSLSSSMECADCHVVPRTLDEPGHLDDAPGATPGDILFGPLARTGGASPTYVAQGCAATYCHGNFPGGTAGNTPRWINDTGQGTCGACHGLPPSTGRHEAHVGAPDVTCVSCHGTFGALTHVDGVKTVTLQAWNPAPPRFCAAACHDARVWGE